MLGSLRRVDFPEYPTDGMAVRAVKLCLALAREVWMITMAIHVGHVVIYVRPFSG